MGIPEITLILPNDLKRMSEVDFHLNAERFGGKSVDSVLIPDKRLLTLPENYTVGIIVSAWVQNEMDRTLQLQKINFHVGHRRITASFMTTGLLQQVIIRRLLAQRQSNKLLVVQSGHYFIFSIDLPYVVINIKGQDKKPYVVTAGAGFDYHKIIKKISEERPERE